MPTSLRRTRLPKRWTRDDLQSDAAVAKGIFRELVDRLTDIAANPVDAELIADIIDGRDAQKAFRYLTAPPISADDLETVADAVLTPSRLRADADSAKRIRDTVLTIIDPPSFSLDGAWPQAIQR